MKSMRELVVHHYKYTSVTKSVLAGLRSKLERSHCFQYSYIIPPIIYIIECTIVYI